MVEVQPGTFGGGRTISAASQEGGAEGQPNGGTEAVSGLAGRLLAGLHPSAQRMWARLDVRTAYPQRDFRIRLFSIGFFRRCCCCRHWFSWLFCQQGLLGSTSATAGTTFRHLRIQLPVVATQVGDIVNMKLGLAQKGRETLGAGALPQILDAELPAQLRPQARRKVVLMESAAALIRARGAQYGVAAGVRLQTRMFARADWL